MNYENIKRKNIVEEIIKNTNIIRIDLLVYLKQDEVDLAVRLI